MDLTDTIVPKSDQLNSDDLFAAPRTVTITEVVKGSTEQPVDIHLAEFPGRPFRPSKTVRRILVAAWGKDGDAYVGRRLTLYRDPDVRFGGQDVGGIRVSAMSHIDKPLKLALTVSKGKKAPYVVQPLADAPAPAQAAPTADELIEAAQNAGSNDELNRIARTAVASLGKSDLDAVKAIVTARRAELAEPTLPEGAGSVPTLPGAES
jgi:hypothetical protein